MNFKKIHVKQESAQPYKVISDQCTVCITKERCNQCIKKYKYYKGFFNKQDDLICIFHISFLSFDYYLNNPINFFMVINYTLHFYCNKYFDILITVLL